MSGVLKYTTCLLLPLIPEFKLCIFNPVIIPSLLNTLSLVPLIVVVAWYLVSLSPKYIVPLLLCRFIPVAPPELSCKFVWFLYPFISLYNWGSNTPPAFKLSKVWRDVVEVSIYISCWFPEPVNHEISTSGAHSIKALFLIPKKKFLLRELFPSAGIVPVGDPLSITLEVAFIPPVPWYPKIYAPLPEVALNFPAVIVIWSIIVLEFPPPQ